MSEQFKNKDFSDIIDFLSQLQLRLNKTYVYFYTWKNILDFITINEDKSNEEEIEKNLYAISSYGYFFESTMILNSQMCLMELCKFYDPQSKAISLLNFIKILKLNRDEINVESFIKFNLGRPFLDNLVKSFEGLTDDILDEIENNLKLKGLTFRVKNIQEDVEKIYGEIDNDSCIGRFKTFRDQNLAHDDLNKKEVNIYMVEINEIMSLTSDILNSLSNKLNHSTFSYSQSVKECDEYFALLGNDLKKINKLPKF